MAAILNGVRNLFTASENQREKTRNCLDFTKVALRITAVALIAFAIFCHTIPAWLIFLPLAYVCWEVSVLCQSAVEIQERAPARVSKKEFGEELFRYAPIFYPIHRICLRIPRYSQAWNRLYQEYNNIQVQGEVELG